MQYKFYTLCIFIFLTLPLFAQKGVISGTVHSHGLPLSFATVGISNTSLGVITDEKGAFSFDNLPFDQYELVISSVGFKNHQQIVQLTQGQPKIFLEVSLVETASLLDEVVVSGTRTERYRSDLAVPVQILTAAAFESTQSASLADGLNYQAGLRMETDCQTCNYTQLRINGLGGGYSQILINSRPIFSALNGLYGLEQIPANMIDRVEVVRGGGSALFGSSAIAGTVNVLTKLPTRNDYEVSLSHSFINGEASDNLLNANLTQVNSLKNAGISIFASRRQRQEWDANGDGFSELPRLMNTSFGIHSFFEPSKKWRFNLSLNSIGEQRDGGDQLNEAPHKRRQSEQRINQTMTGNLDAIYTLNNQQNLQIYAGMQNTDRSHYTGIDGVDGYGVTDNYTLQGGLQYNHTLTNFFGGVNTFTLGTEYQLDDIFDEISAYNYLIDQRAIQSGTFMQSDWEITEKLTLLTGARLTYHNLAERIVLTPRISAMYELMPLLKSRFSYGRGFRAPQAFDADLHIAFSGGGISTIRLAENLQSEFSDSYTLSLDYDKATERAVFGVTLAGFLTNLENVFVLEEIGTDAAGNVQLEKRNGNSSVVKGITLEGRANLDNLLEMDAGITFQQSEFSNPVTWSADISGTQDYLRTPDSYGYFTLNIVPQNRLSATFSGVYTGRMFVPHFGGAPGVEGDRLERTPQFLETTIRLTYDFNFFKIKQKLQVATGVQNIFNAYQSDFDIGKERDSNYVYGPARPRTFFFSLKIGME